MWVYRVAIMNCIWFRSLDCGYTWALLNTALPFQLHRHSLLWSHCCWAELMHKAATVTFNNAHIARAINTMCRLMETKRRRRKIPSSAQSAYMTKWKLKQWARATTQELYWSYWQDHRKPWTRQSLCSWRVKAWMSSIQARIVTTTLDCLAVWFSHYHNDI